LDVDLQIELTVGEMDAKLILERDGQYPAEIACHQNGFAQ
jgi:hypothetical protein